MINGHCDVVTVSLERKAVISTCENNHGDRERVPLETEVEVTLQPPLWSAGWEGHSYEINMMLKSDADMNPVRKDGLTALMFASMDGHVDAMAGRVRK